MHTTTSSQRRRAMLAATALALAVALMGILSGPSRANAQVDDADGAPGTPEAHPGAIIDMATNLLWLDATETRNRSLADVSSELGFGGEFEGFELATRAQIHQLFNNAGILLTSPGPGFVISPGQQDVVQDFVAIYGQTDTSPTLIGTSLWHANTLDNPGSHGAQSVLWSTTSNGYWAGDDGTSTAFAGTAHPNFGVALVRPNTCGNGFVDSNETCDEGAANGTNASCCSNACTFDAPGAECDDGDACSLTSECDGLGGCWSNESTLSDPLADPDQTVQCLVQIVESLP